MLRTGCVFLVVLSGACASTGSDTEASENRMAEVKISESDSLLEISGWDAEGNQFASLRLERGTFAIEDYGQKVDARRLTVEVDGQETVHESAAADPVQLPLMQGEVYAELNAFLLDARVQPLLARRQIRVTNHPVELAKVEGAAAPPSETSYDYCSYGIACNGAGAIDCDQAPYYPNGWCDASPATTWGHTQYVCCATSLTWRLCGLGGGNPCGGEGPNGCKSCWTTGHGGSCATYTTYPIASCGEFNNYITDIYADW